MPCSCLILQIISYAGFNFIQELNRYDDRNPSCEGFSSLNGELLSLNLKYSGEGGCELDLISKEKVNDIDEFLIIFDSTQSTGIETSNFVGIGLTDKTYYNKGYNVMNALNTYSLIGNSLSSDRTTLNKNQYFDPKVYKIKNNFDGTYSVLASLGVGDVFIEKSRQTVPKDISLYLVIQISAGGGTGAGNAVSSMTIYNIVRKENAFAICKADQFMQDTNQDEKINTDGTECFDLQTIVLNSEEAIKESYDEKILRLTAELESKNAGLTTDITTLKQQLADQQLSGISQSQIGELYTKLTALQQELSETKSTLNSIQTGNKNVIAIIEQQEFLTKEKIPTYVYIIIGSLIIILIIIILIKIKK